MISKFISWHKERIIVIAKKYQLSLLLVNSALEVQTPMILAHDPITFSKPKFAEEKFRTFDS